MRFLWYECLPRYLPLGALCGLYAIWFNKLSTYSVDLFSQLSDSGIPKYVHPPLGGVLALHLSIKLIARLVIARHFLFLKTCVIRALHVHTSAEAVCCYYCVVT